MGEKVLTVGGLTTDLFGQTLKRAGQKIYLGGLRQRHGGGARNVSLALKVLGFKVWVLGAVGNDPFGAKILKELKSAEVDISYIQVKGSLTGLSLITEEEILSLRGANDELSLSDGLDLANFDWLFVASVPPRFQKVLLQVVARIKQLPSIYLSPGVHQLGEGRGDLLQLIPYADVLQLNLEEARILCQDGDPPELAQQLSSMGPRIAIVTAGDKGAWATVGDKLLHQPPLPTKVIDPTGCGDTFAAGTLAGLARGLSLQEALAVGAANAAAVLEHEGVEGFLTWEEALQRAGVFAPEALR